MNLVMVLVNSIFKVIFQILLIVVPPILLIFFFFFAIFAYNYFKIRKEEKIKLKPRNTYIKKTDNLFKTIFIKFPKQLAYDILSGDPDSFNEFGIHMVCGSQGSGKTITVAYLLKKWKEKYPKMKIYTNMDYKYEDGELNTFDELIERTNGIYGVVNVIDETPNWFSSSDSKNVPVEVLSEISQQRKQKKAILGTGQVFGKIAKPLREQTHFVYLPRTFLGCLTVVWKAKAEDYDSDRNRFRKRTIAFIFAHDRDLRESYDTYKKILRYKDVQFMNSSGSSVGLSDDDGTS